MKKGLLTNRFVWSVVLLAAGLFAQPALAQTTVLDSTGEKPEIWSDLPREEVRYEMVEAAGGEVVAAEWLRVEAWYRDSRQLSQAMQLVDSRKNILLGNFSPMAELGYLELLYNEKTKHFGLVVGYRTYTDIMSGEPLMRMINKDGELLGYVPMTQPFQGGSGAGEGYTLPPAGIVGDF